MRIINGEIEIRQVTSYRWEVRVEGRLRGSGIAPTKSDADDQAAAWLKGFMKTYMRLVEKKGGKDA